MFFNNYPSGRMIECVILLYNSILFKNLYTIIKCKYTNFSPYEQISGRFLTIITGRTKVSDNLPPSILTQATFIEDYPRPRRINYVIFPLFLPNKTERNAYQGITKGGRTSVKVPPPTICNQPVDCYSTGSSGLLACLAFSNSAFMVGLLRTSFFTVNSSALSFARRRLFSLPISDSLTLFR